MKLKQLSLPVIIFLLLVGCSSKEKEISERVQRLTESAELGTVEYKVKKIVKTNDDQWYSIGERKILFSSTAYLKAGVKLDGFSTDDVQIDGRNVTVTLPHARTSTAQDALQAVSKIGFGALKTVSVAGKVATLGMGGKVLDNVEKVANKALQTGALELVNVWRQKLETSFKNAKKLEGGLLSKDKEFANSLSDLRKQYESA